MKNLFSFIIIFKIFLISCNNFSVYNAKERTKKFKLEIDYVNKYISTKNNFHENVLKSSKNLVLYNITKPKFNTDYDFLSFIDLDKNIFITSKSDSLQLNKVFNNFSDTSRVKVFIMKDKLLLKNLFENNYLTVYGGNKEGVEEDDYTPVKKTETFYETFKKVKRLTINKNKMVDLYKSLLKSYKYFKQKNKYNSNFDNNLDFIYNSKYNKYLFKILNKNFKNFNLSDDANNNDNNNDEKTDDNYIWDSTKLLRSIYPFAKKYEFKKNKFTPDNRVIKFGKFNDSDALIFNEIAKNENFLSKNKIIEDINNFSKYYSYLNFKNQYLYSGEWIMINEEYALKAAEEKIPAQSTSITDWTCGPNAAARSLIILYNGKNNFNYDKLIECCPKYVSRQETRKACSRNIIGGGIAAAAGILTAPIGGLVLTGVAYSFMAGNAIIGDTILNVGPCPDQLTKYINFLLKKIESTDKNYYAYFRKFKIFENFENHIIKCVISRHPCILLLIRGAVDMHYVNIIGISMKKNSMKKNIVDKFAVLDNKTKYFLKRDKFKYWMQNSVPNVTSSLVTLFKGGSIGNFNLIEIDWGLKKMNLDNSIFPIL